MLLALNMPLLWVRRSEVRRSEGPNYGRSDKFEIECIGYLSYKDSPHDKQLPTCRHYRFTVCLYSCAIMDTISTLTCASIIRLDIHSITGNNRSLSR